MPDCTLRGGDITSVDWIRFHSIDYQKGIGEELHLLKFRVQL